MSEEQKTKTVARIHQAPTGRYYITDDALPYLDESGNGYPSERIASKQARELGYNHRLNRHNKTVKL